MTYGVRFPRVPCRLLLLVLLLSSATAGWAAPSSSSAVPAQKLDLLSKGFRPLSKLERITDESHFTVDYFDSDHVLVTFDRPGLMQRRRDCPSTHRDRIVKVLVYRLSTATVERQAEWYLHDRMPYVWALGGGNLLLRRANRLYKLNSNLEEKLFYESPSTLIWTGVTADRSQIITETKIAGPEPVVTQRGAKATDLFDVRFLDVSTAAAVRVMQTRQPIRLEANGRGYVDSIGNVSNSLWLVRFGPVEHDRSYVARVRSRCTPDVMLASANTLLVGRCSGDGGYSYSTFTVSGQRVWRQKSEDRFFAPKALVTENGERFAVSMLRRPLNWTVPTKPEDVPDEDDEKVAPWMQMVEVYEIGSGVPVLKVEASPYIIGGHQAALAPDGSSVAVLRDAAVLFYPLPPISADEKAKALALKADMPGLYMPSAGNDEALDLQEALSEPGDRKPTVKPAAQAMPSFPSAPSGPPAASGAASSPSDSQQAPAPGTMTIRKTTMAVVVDAVVTDSKGHPVQGLKKEDFTVTEESTPQKLRSFEEHRLGQKKAAAAPPPQVTANTFTNASVQTEHADSVTIILYDSLNSSLEAQGSAQKQLVEYLKSKPKGERVALFQLTSTLRMISGFTDSEEALMAAVQGKTSKLRVTAPMRAATAGYDTAMNRLQSDSKNSGRWQEAQQVDMMRLTQMREENRVNDLKVGFTLDAFSQMARYLSGIPGRKNLVWLSGSFPIAVFLNAAIPSQVDHTRGYQGSVKKTMDLLAAAHVAVYPIGIEGNQTLSGYAASERGNPTASTDILSNNSIRNFKSQGEPTQGGGSTPQASNNTPGSISNQNLDMRAQGDKLASTTAAMEMVAAETGGKAYTSTNALKQAISDAVEHGSDYYTLSYSPANLNFDGRFRKINVAVPSGDYRLTYRKGYYADDPSAPPQHTEDLSRDLSLAAMQQGTPESREIAFLVRVNPVGKPREATPVELGEKPTKKNAGSTIKVQRYALDWAVSGRDLRFQMTQDGKRHGSLNLMITAFDDAGRLVRRFGTSVTSDLGTANYQQIMAAGFRIHNEVEIPVEAISMRVGALDSQSGKIGTLEIKFPIPPAPEMPVRNRRAIPEVEPD